MTVTGGVLAIDNDNELGNPSNGLILNVNATTAAGLLATGTFGTSRTITLNQANNVISVTSGTTLTLNTPFAFGAANAGLSKNDNGNLILTASNTRWTGALTINAGAVEVTSPAVARKRVRRGCDNITGSELQLVGNGHLYQCPHRGQHRRRHRRGGQRNELQWRPGECVRK